MKIHVPKDYGNKKVPHLLPLYEEDEDTVLKEDLKGFDIRANPAEEKPTYKVYLRALKGAESIRNTIRWVQEMGRVLTGVKVTEYKAKRAIIHEMLRGIISSLFDTALNNHAATVRFTAAEAAAREVSTKNAKTEARNALR